LGPLGNLPLPLLARPFSSGGQSRATMALKVDGRSSRHQDCHACERKVRVRSDLHVTHAIVMSVQPPGLALLTVAGCLHVKCEVNYSFAACTSVLSPVKVPPAWQRRHHPAEEAVHDAGSIGKRLSYDGLHAARHQ
jgi:hypothetical protein